jgi:hypothetical protein
LDDEIGLRGKLRNVYRAVKGKQQGGDNFGDLGRDVRIITKAYLRENGMMILNGLNWVRIRHNGGLSFDQQSNLTFQEIPCSMKYSSFSPLSSSVLKDYVPWAILFQN